MAASGTLLDTNWSLDDDKQAQILKNFGTQARDDALQVACLGQTYNIEIDNLARELIDLLATQTINRSVSSIILEKIVTLQTKLYSNEIKFTNPAARGHLLRLLRLGKRWDYGDTGLKFAEGFSNNSDEVYKTLDNAIKEYLKCERIDDDTDLFIGQLVEQLCAKTIDEDLVRKQITFIEESLKDNEGNIKENKRKTSIAQLLGAVVFAVFGAILGAKAGALAGGGVMSVPGAVAGGMAGARIGYSVGFILFNSANPGVKDAIQRHDKANALIEKTKQVLRPR